MLIDSISLPQTVPSLLSAKLQTWTLGQLLSASVIGRDSENSIRLRIGADIVRAHTTTALPRGTELTLRVSKPGPQPELQVVLSSAGRTKRVVIDGLRQALPRQTPLLDAARQIATLAKPANSQSTQLPQSVLAPVQQTLKTMPTISDVVEPVRLKLTLENAGVFLEAKIAKQVSTTSRIEQPADLKWNLARIAAAITEKTGDADRPIRIFPERLTHQTKTTTSPLPSTTPKATSSMNIETVKPPNTASAPPSTVRAVNDEMQMPVLKQLQHYVEGALARIETHQLQSVRIDGEMPHQWLFELPINTGKDMDLLQLRVQQEQVEGADEGELIFNIRLSIDLAGAGHVDAGIEMRGDSLAIQLWAEQPDYRRQLERAVENLQQQLSARGMHISHVTFREFSEPAISEHPQVELIDTAV